MKFRCTQYGTGDAAGRAIKVLDIEAGSYAGALRKAQRELSHPIGVKVKC